MSKSYKIYGDDLPPESPEEKEWKSPWDGPDEQDGPKTELNRVKEQIPQIIEKTQDKAVSEEKKPIAVSAPTPKKTPKTKSELKKAWKLKHRDHYLAKNREYVKNYRLRKKHKSQ